MLERRYYVYILTNVARTVLYVGVTNNLVRRVYEHQQHFVEGFTKRYRIDRLLHYEEFSTVYDAISREKELKGRGRRKKCELIQRENPSLRDLSGILSM
ncbi:MAG: GIY-YIG nuclease family protein [Candidatus Uhrbacteria bacterium]